jgi:ribosomal protein S18 acetylase RimI-like enzyme
MPEGHRIRSVADGVSEDGAATIGPLTPAGRTAAADVLARAFRDNPINRAVVGDGEERRLRANRAGLRRWLAACDGRPLALAASEARTDVKNPRVDAIDSGHPRGVLMALPPGLFPLPPPSLLAQLRIWIGQGRRVAERWAQVYRSLEDVHPDAPHWYLSLLGVDPAHQGRGLGRSLLESWLRSVDREAAASYLETDREQNLAFYRRAGFDVRAEIRVLGIDVWCMWRPPRPAASAAIARRST